MKNIKTQVFFKVSGGVIITLLLFLAGTTSACAFAEEPTRTPRTSIPDQYGIPEPITLDPGETYKIDKATLITAPTDSNKEEQVILGKEEIQKGPDESPSIGSNIERVDLPYAISRYKFEYSKGSWWQMNIYEKNNPNQNSKKVEKGQNNNLEKVIKINIKQNKSTQLAFADGLVQAELNKNNVVEVGGAPVPFKEENNPKSITPEKINKNIVSESSGESPKKEQKEDSGSSFFLVDIFQNFWSFLTSIFK